MVLNPSTESVLPFWGGSHRIIYLSQSLVFLLFDRLPDGLSLPSFTCVKGKIEEQKLNPPLTSRTCLISNDKTSFTDETTEVQIQRNC
jgi:hypothetical protein